MAVQEIPLRETGLERVLDNQATTSIHVGKSSVEALKEHVRYNSATVNGEAEQMIKW